jgi:hypothetical protein
MINLHCKNVDPRMSQLGQNTKGGPGMVISAFGSKKDMAC